jgi:hypothetical protein
VIWAANDFAENRAFFPSTRLFEIYSSHGQSELFDTTGPLAYEQQVSAPFTLSRKGAFYARDAWALGHRLVTVASSDDHNGQPGKPHNGLTAVFAPRLDRPAIHAALRGGTTYGTTGERILLAFSANGAAMGSAVSVPKGAPLAFRIQVHGTGPLDRVEVFRHVAGGSNGWETVFSRTGIGDLDFEGEWSEPSPGPAVYYARVTQATAHEVYVPVYQRRPAMAWSSPIWIEAPAR